MSHLWQTGHRTGLKSLDGVHGWGAWHDLCRVIDTIWRLYRMFSVPVEAPGLQIMLLISGQARLRKSFQPLSVLQVSYSLAVYSQPLDLCLSPYLEETWLVTPAVCKSAVIWWSWIFIPKYSQQLSVCAL